MALSVQCGSCGARYNVDEKLAGKRAKCKKCGATMSIPAPAAEEGDEGLAALMELAGAEAPAPPPPRPPAAPRGWTPESVVVEHAVAAPEPAARRTARKPPPVSPESVAKLIALLFIGCLVGVGVMLHHSLSTAAAARGVELGFRPYASIWVRVGGFALLFFAVTVPLTMIGPWLAAKVTRDRLPFGYYFFTLAVAAVPVIAMLLIAMASVSGVLPSDRSLVFVFLVVAAALTVVLVRFLFDFRWLSAAVAWGAGLVPFFIGASLAAGLTNVVANAVSGASRDNSSGGFAMFGGSRELSVPTEGQRSTRRRASAAAPDNAATPTPAPAPQVTETQRKRDESATHLRHIHAGLMRYFARSGRSWAPSLDLLRSTDSIAPNDLTSPFGPVLASGDYGYTPYVQDAVPGADVILAHDAAELTNGEGANVLFGNGTVKWLPRDDVQSALQQSEAVRTAAANERQQRMAQAGSGQPGDAGASAAFPGDEGAASPGSVPTVRGRPGRGGAAAARLKPGASGWVKDAEALPLGAASAEALVRPMTPASAVAVVTRNNTRGDTVEVFAGEPPASKATASFPVDPSFRGGYALSADGNFLARLVSFPRTQAVVYSFEKKADVATMDLKAAPGVQPSLVGFTAPDRLAVRWTRGTDSAVELWDVKGSRSLRRLPLPELQRPSPANEAVSSDGRQLAVTGRGKLRGKESLQLAVYTLVGPGDPRRLPLAGLDEQFLAQAETSGIAFSPDNGRVAALFEVGGKGLVVVWNLRTGKNAGEFVIPSIPDVPTDARMARTRGIDWVAGGRALLVCGSVLLDADRGSVLATLEAGKVRGQAVVGSSTAVLAYGEGLHVDEVVAATLDEAKLPGATPTGGAPK
jgi:hypothetical protein